MRTPLSRLFAVAIALAAFPLLASTADAQSRLRGVFRLAGELGGDRVAEFEYSDGSTPEVTAGGGLLLTAGGVATLPAWGAHSLDAQVNLGLKYRTIPPATNQEATWLRFPLEALLYYRHPSGFRFGGGATVHLRNVLEVKGDVLNDRIEFGNSPGLLLQAEYIRQNFAFDLRYTSLQYEVTSGGSGTVDASSIGLGVSYFLGQAAPKQ